MGYLVIDDLAVALRSGRYNRSILLRLGLTIVSRIASLLVVICASLEVAPGQALPSTSLLVMPFENQSEAPGIEWISEAFPEVLSQRMASPRTFAISREDRNTAFDHSGIPPTVRPSRATIYRIAEQMDADYVVLGTYNFDGSTFTASAQLLDMKKLHLNAPVKSSGLLTDLIMIQTGLAWELLRQMPDPPSVTREQYLRTSAPIRLDGFENYVRGIMATNHQQKIRYFRDAIRLDPTYTLAMVQLGKAYYDSHEYESAAVWFARVPKNDPAGGEANFLLGMSEFYHGSFDKSYAAFTYLAGRLPLTEVYNNLGVVESRRGRKTSAVEYFSKAVNADPSDADYRFNLAVALYKNGDSAGAARQLKEELQRRPADGEAKSLLDLVSRPASLSAANAAAGAGTNAMFPSSQAHVPLERIKQNYDEASYRQLEMEIHNLSEERLAKTDRQSQATYHLERGQQLLTQNKPIEAEAEYREAVGLDYNNASAHAGLAGILEGKGDTAGARTEAQTSVHLHPNVDAYLSLARLNLKQNHLSQAADAVTQALKLDPSNEAALGLRRQVAAKQGIAQ